MRIQAVLFTDFMSKFTDCFNEAQTFIVTYCTANLNDMNVAAFSGCYDCLLNRTG